MVADDAMAEAAFQIVKVAGIELPKGVLFPGYETV